MKWRCIFFHAWENWSPEVVFRKGVYLATGRRCKRCGYAVAQWRVHISDEEMKRL